MNLRLPFVLPILCPVLCGLLAAAAGPSARAASLESTLAAAPFPMPTPVIPLFPDRRLDITAFGAVGDGHTLNTAAIARAITACVQAGGGHVVIPAGLWLTGPIELRGSVDLHAERGALVVFTADHSAYPMVPRERGGFAAASCISASGQDNIAVTGDGVFDGAGDTWRPVRRSKVTEAQWEGLLARGGATSNGGQDWWPTREAMTGEDYLAALDARTAHPTAEESLPGRDFRRSPMVSFTGCRNVLVEGVTLRNSPSGILVPARCTNVTIRGATLFNEWWAQNGDGMDIGPCHNVVVFQCTLSTGDDAICMKSSGRNPWPGEPGLENVVVAECTVFHGHGGFVVGGSTEAGMRNLWATRCTFVGTDTGIRVKSGLGHGGLVRDVWVDHVVMKDIANAAITFDTFYDNDPVSASAHPAPLSRDPGRTPEFRAFSLSDIFCLGAGTAITIRGLAGHPVHDVVIARSFLSARRGFHATDAEDIILKGVRIETPEAPAVVQHNTRGIQVLD